jgi:hypothetical protein
MSDEQRVWLVERTYTDKGLVTVVYATPDGERQLVEQLSAKSRRETTAARDVDPDKLAETDPDDRERYAAEVDRMAQRHEPDDVV